MQQWEGKEGENALGKEFRDSQLFLLRWHWIKNSREVVTSSWVKRFKRKNQQQPPGQFYPVNIVEKKMYARFLFFLSPPPPPFSSYLQTKRSVLATETRETHCPQTLAVPSLFPEGDTPAPPFLALSPAPLRGPQAPILLGIVSRTWTFSINGAAFFSPMNGQKWGSGWEQLETVISLWTSHTISHILIFIRN